VAAFTDSTIFSNFAAFEDGKPELLLGMIEWLNHRDSASSQGLRWLGGLAAMACLGAGLALSAKSRVAWVLLVATVLGAAAVAGVSAREINRKAMPLPEPVRPYTSVVIDRTICHGPLSESGFTEGKDIGFGIFERWILRLGWFTSRRAGANAFSGDLLVYLCPTQTVTDDVRRNLLSYVERGGRVLVVDTPANASSSANGLLIPFGMSLDRQTQVAPGLLRTEPNWPSVSVDSALTVTGGRAVAWVGDTPVAAIARRGQGLIAVLGIGSRFCDAAMGVTGDVEPDQELKKVFDLEYALLRAIMAHWSRND
jgi:hypothetical protein